MNRPLVTGLTLAFRLGVVSVATAQVGTPTYLAPVRAFRGVELGALLSFPEAGGTGIEGVFRSSTGATDVGFRGGRFQPEGLVPSSILAGFDIRTPLVPHSGTFPLDASLIFGAGGSFRQHASRFTIPLGLSIGRRFDIRTSASIIPYAQPTTLIRGGNGLPSQVLYGLGLGTDVRVSALDLRFGISLGDLKGVSFGAALVH
jgi:hypothetical protein